MIKFTFLPHTSHLANCKSTALSDVWLNGKHLGSKVFESSKGYEDLTLKFKATDLVVGRNEFLILDETVLDPSDTNYGWVNLDYIRIEPYYCHGFSVILR